MTTIGIDLGTTNSAVATTDANGITTTLADRDGSRFLPSVVHFTDSNEVVIGDRAKSMAVIEPDRVAMLFKRGMGEQTFLADGSDFVVDGKVWRPEELSALILKKMKQLAEDQLGPINGAIITVPAYFGELERSATRDAAEIAGLPVLRILNEPTAAAIAFGLDEGNRGQHVLVFDLGGGTFDVTVMHIGEDGEMQVRSTGGNHRLGGADFDRIIVDEMVERAEREAGADILAEPWMLQEAREKAEDLKKELSTSSSASRPVSTGQRPYMFTLTRDRFVQLMEDILEDVGDMIDLTLGDSGLEPAEIDTVLMVGGSSRIPAFADLLRQKFGKEPTFSRNLDEDVARGASILAAKFGGEVNPGSDLAQLISPTDVASHGLGLTALDDAGNPYNALVIPPGSGVPCTRREDFASVVDGQTSVRLRINEGDEADLAYVREIGQGDASFGRPVPAQYPIVVEISYTEEQIVEVVAFDGVTEQRIGEVSIDRQGALSKAEKNDALAQIRALEVD